jgi:hypothetical protein
MNVGVMKDYKLRYLYAPLTHLVSRLLSKFICSFFFFCSSLLADFFFWFPCTETTRRIEY